MTKNAQFCGTHIISVIGCENITQQFTWYYSSLYSLPGDGDDAQDGEEDDHDTARD